MNKGFKLKLFYKFETFIDKIKNLGPNLKYDLNLVFFFFFFNVSLNLYGKVIE